MSTIMGHKYGVPHLWSEQMGEVVAERNEFVEGVYIIDQSLEEMQQAYRAERIFWNEGGPSMVVCVDQKAPICHGAARVRHYRPGEQGPLPLIVFIREGGWVIGGVDTHDRITHIPCHLTGAATVSIDYTLVPGTRFPQQIHEYRNVAAHIREQAEEWGIVPEDVSFAGDSVGANVAAMAMPVTRDEGVLIQTRTILLSYSVYGFKDPMPMRLLGGAWDGLTEVDYVYYLDQYFAEPENVDNPYFNVLDSGFNTGIPSCYTVAADLNPLRDDLRILVEILGLCSVLHLYNEVEGVIHGFLHRSRMLGQTTDALKEAARFYAEHPVRHRVHTLTHRK